MGGGDLGILFKRKRLQRTFKCGHVFNAPDIGWQIVLCAPALVKMSFSDAYDRDALDQARATSFRLRAR